MYDILRFYEQRKLRFLLLKESSSVICFGGMHAKMEKNSCMPQPHVHGEYKVGSLGSPPYEWGIISVC